MWRFQSQVSAEGINVMAVGTLLMLYQVLASYFSG